VSKFRKYRLPFVLLFFSVFVCFVGPPMLNAQEAGEEPIRTDNESSAAVDPGVERPASALNDVNLNFRLIGTAVVENSGKSLAVIEHRNTGKQVACWEGGSLGQVIIKRILWNRVIIDTGNGEMVLSMGPGGKLGEGKARIPKTSRRAGNVTASAYPARLNRKELAKEFPDYTSLLQTVKIKTHFQAGSPEGILLDHIEPGCLFFRNIAGADNTKLVVSCQKDHWGHTDSTGHNIDTMIFF